MLIPAKRFNNAVERARSAAQDAEAQLESAQQEADAAEQRASEARATADAATERAKDQRSDAEAKREAATEQREQAAKYRRLANESDGSDNTERTRFVYNGDGRLLGRYTNSGEPVREYVRLGDRPIAVIAEGNVRYIQTDHLGTPRAISKPDGPVIWRWQASPYGQGAPDEDPDGDGESFTFNLRLPGQYFDAETGTHYNYFRDYDPDIGRYTTPDPIGLKGGSANLYGYVVNDPVSATDLIGLAPLISSRGNPPVFK